MITNTNAYHTNSSVCRDYKRIFNICIDMTGCVEATAFYINFYILIFRHIYRRTVTKITSSGRVMLGYAFIYHKF